MFTLLATWALGAGARLSFGDRQLGTDCAVFGVAAALLARKEFMLFLYKTWDASAAAVGSSTVALALIIVPLAFLRLRSWRTLSNNTKANDLPEDIRNWNVQHPRAKIFPCETKHARIFPKSHAFEYSYLQCGFPIIPGGVTADGRDVATGTDQHLGNWWLRVRAGDYLSRGNGSAGFYGKLQIFMREQNVDDKEWSYAYLVTAPRFFGYSFNPVSFWYVYDQEHRLKKMILEVNNTFGERRIYLLDGTGTSSPPQTPETTPEMDAGSEISPEILASSKSRFTDHWMKDFHVSPFNSRRGSYALRAQNPFPYAGYDKPMIDNTITLKSSKDHAKVVARLKCVGTPLDPLEFGVLGAAWFIVKWWWVGLVTFPRILKEAFALFYKRGLNVWFRPEVLGPSLGRLPTSSEVVIQHIFHDYLNYLVNTAQNDFRIILWTAIPEVPKSNIIFTRPARGDTAKEIEIRILTPAFYSRFVHYAYSSEAFDRECIFTDEKNRTCWISRPELLVELLSESRPGRFQSVSSGSLLRELRWSILRRLRCAPAEPAYNASPRNPEYHLEDIRAARFSEMDMFVRSKQRQDHVGMYRRIVTKLFLAQRCCLGFPQIVSLIDWSLRITLCYCAARQTLDSVGPTQGISFNGNWWLCSRGVAAVTAVHVYALFKGYH